MSEGHPVHPGQLWWREVVRLEAETKKLRQQYDRALYLAEHLFQMVSTEVWRDSGGDDGQGHYEGDYRAEMLHLELEALKNDA